MTSATGGPGRTLATGAATPDLATPAGGSRGARGPRGGSISGGEEPTAPVRSLRQDNSIQILAKQKVHSTKQGDGCKTNLVTSRSSSLPRETEGILANPVGGAELRGGTTKGSVGSLVCLAPEDDSLAPSTFSTSTCFAGDEAEADSPLFRFRRFGSGSSSSSKVSLREVAEGISSSSTSSSSGNSASS